ncbi:3-oxoacyl-[acyl-carrier protein] reductase [Methylocaldum sp. RMAD-M]|nr:3-oxoacyl-[acyl-carrier protein] reductase [Methylocaldum sp. RMAD-M]
MGAISMGLLDGKRALVCGSSQGIGRAIAMLFADQGAEVVLLARNESALKLVCGGLSSAHRQKHGYLVADFGHPDRLKQILEERLPALLPIHILVNNTGGPPGGLLYEAGIEEFTRAFTQHLICSHILVQALLPGMRSESFGRIINIVSTSVKQPIPGLGVSNAVRGAMANWAKTLAGELAPFGITVNNILPGATETARLRAIMEAKARSSNKSIDDVVEQTKRSIPLGRFGKPEEIAYAAGFLASDLASYITGINLPVDGGRTMSL